MPTPFVSNSQYDPKKHAYHPDCVCSACNATFQQRLAARNALHYTQYDAAKPGFGWSAWRWLFLLGVSLAIVGVFLGIILAGQALAREGNVQPILRPVGLYQAKQRCSNQTPKLECRAELRRALAAIAWNKATRRHLERRLAAFQRPVEHLAEWTCIHQHEGAWDSATGNGYWGGLQMNWAFMRTYGSDMLAKYGGEAHLWTPRDQMIVAERAYDAGRGFNPWPNTARMCGLL